jgi:hypothetical protein
VKQAILLIILGAAIGGGAVWMAKRGAAAKPAAAVPAAAAPDEAKTTITHDTNGCVVIGMSDEMQGDAGIVVANPVAAQFSPEVKGFGRVLDPAPLSALMTELASDLAAYGASSSELARLKTLAPTGNASPRALQAAEAAALRDQLAAQSVRDRLVLAWGKAVAGRNDLPAFIQALAVQDVALVRVDLTAGETLQSSPTGARVVTLAGGSADAELLGTAPGVDPQVQGRGFLFLIKPNALRLLPGQGVTGYLKLPGEPLAGVIVPRESVVRTEGKGWIYVLNAGGESLTRKEIPLDCPTEAGWFVPTGVSASDHVVVIGAQALLSEELKASIVAN